MGLRDYFKELADRADPREGQYLALEASMIAFQGTPEEVSDILPALLGRDMCADEEIAHYLKFFRKAIERYAQRQLAGYPAEDEMDLSRAYRDRDL